MNAVHAIQTIWPDIIGVSTGIILGAIFVAAGLAHFVICKDFSNMMPAKVYTKLHTNIYTSQ